MAYYINNDDSIAVAQIPKAGLMTMREWLVGWRVVKNDYPGLIECPVRVAFISNPLTRLPSCFSYFLGKKNGGAPLRSEAPLDSWHEFVDYALENDDSHWRPQIVHTGGLQTIVHRLEHLRHVFYRYNPHPFVQTNRSMRIQVDSYRWREILGLYERDIDMYLGAELV